MGLESHHNMPDHTLCLASSYCSPLLGARLHCIKVSTSHTRVSLLAIAAPLPGTTLRQRLHIAFLTAVQAVTVCGVAAAEPSKGERERTAFFERGHPARAAKGGLDAVRTSGGERGAPPGCAGRARTCALTAAAAWAAGVTAGAGLGDRPWPASASSASSASLRERAGMGMAVIAGG